MEQITRIIELLKKPFNQDESLTVEIMGLWKEDEVSELLKMEHITSNKFIMQKLPLVEKYIDDIYTNIQGDKSYLKPVVIQTLKQLIKPIPVKQIDRFK